MNKISNSQFKLRFKAFFYHIFFSVILLCIALGLVFGIWYPSPLDIAVGVTSVYLILLTVDLILGPLLTFIIYKKDKKKLKFDLTVILLLQMSAYIWGLYTIAQGRPVWQVFVVDDIELVSPIDIRKTKDYEMKVEYRPSIFKKPQWIAAVYSENPEKMQQQKQDEMFEGINLSMRPETYKDIEVQKNLILKKLKPFSELEKINLNTNAINSILVSYSTAVGWLPVKASEKDMVALFDKEGTPLTIVNLRPWN